MLFNSLSFFLFLSVVFLVYWRLNKNLRFQNLFLLAVSYFFYGCWDWRFLFLIAASSLTDFVVGLRLQKEQRNSWRKAWLALSLTANLGLLGFFKYFNFFIDSAHVALQYIGLETSFNSLSIILPVGISFYTFQTLSYTIDIYRKRIEPTKNWIGFFAFVSFFPQLVAGPIERASNLLPQFERGRQFNLNQSVKGMRLILWGLFKKMVIADRLAVLIDAIYADPSSCDTPLALLAGVLFAYQVYCDFSGYSDIAIGSARLLGFDLMRNFITPFLSRSMSEIWQRWHVSLSTWFRDYLYIPLGGNRTGLIKWMLITVITFTVSGLWHGADFHFVVWGFSYSIILIIERLLKLKHIGVLPTFLLFSLPTILFRSESMSSAIIMLEQLFSLRLLSFSDWPSEFQCLECTIYTFAFLLVLIVTEYKMGKVDFDESLSRVSGITRWIIYYALLLAIMLFGVMENAPRFIYFQF